MSPDQVEGVGLAASSTASIGQHRAKDAFVGVIKMLCQGLQSPSDVLGHPRWIHIGDSEFWKSLNDRFLRRS
jgi:hypothetical protein